jgi:heptose-I-phosphate ethanolaminephosphotransferase
VALVAVVAMYYSDIGAGLSKYDIYAVLQSNLEESLEFFREYIATPGRCLAFVGIFIPLLAIFRWNAVRYRPRQDTATRRGVVAFVLFALSMTAFAHIEVINYAYFTYYQYYRDLRQFNGILADLSGADNGPAVKRERGELYVIIIGESQNKNLMGCYNSQLSTTPWLSSVKGNSDNYIFFENAYAAAVQTMPALQLALFDGNLARGDSFPHGNNILSVSKKAGFTTLWLSNQKRLGRRDNSVAALAHTADTAWFTPKEGPVGRERPAPDEVLLPRIGQTLSEVDWQGNTLLVIHLMGNHYPYQYRYPQDFPVDDKNADRLLSQPRASGLDERGKLRLRQYLASETYADRTLSRIMDQIGRYAERPVFVLYFSDHGEELYDTKGGGHNPATFTWDMAQIPMFVWTSEGYNRRYPDIGRDLRANAHRLFCNDSVFDLYLGAAHIRAQGYDPTLDISSERYRRPTTTVNLYGRSPGIDTALGE